MRPLKSTFYFKASEKVQKGNRKATRAAANEAAYAQQQQQQRQPKKRTKTKLNQQAAPAYPHPPSGILVKAVQPHTHTHTRTLVRIETNHKLARPRPAKDFDSFKLGLFPAAATSSGPWCHINSLVVIVIIIIMSNIIIVLLLLVVVVVGVVVYLGFIIASLIAN